MPPLNLGLGTNIGRDGQVANVRHINCYVEDAGNDAKAKTPIYVCPGLTRFDNGSYTGATRGLIQLNDAALIAFLGNQVISLDTGGVTTTLSTLVGSGRVFLARNRNAAPQIAIITNSGQYFILQSGTVTEVNDVDLPVSNSVTYLKGFFLFSIADGRIYQSDLDASSVGALAFDSANSRSEGLVRVFAHAGFLYAFGKRTTEIWQADPSLASEPFVFSPIQQDIDLGCIAPHSVTQIGTGLAWIDDDGIVRYGRDGGATRISTHSLERAIEDLSQANRGLIAGRQWFHQGHEFYTLFADDFTWTYDLLTQNWHERQSYSSSTWQVNDIVSFNGKFIAGNAEDGQIWTIDSNAYDEDGELLVMEIHAPNVNTFPGGFIANNIEVDAIMGVGVQATSQGVYFHDGSYADFGDVNDLTTSFTVEAIFNASDVIAQAHRIISKDNGTAGWALSLGDGSPGTLRFYHREMNTIITDSAAGIISRNVNYHAAAVFDATADTTTIYVDGVQVAQVTGQTNPITANNVSLTIGAGPSDPDQTTPKEFKGFVRDVRMWNVARTQAQIIANMHATLVGNESGLTAYWKLDEQTGSIINDSSTSNFDGVLVGDALWSNLFWEHNSDPKLMLSYTLDGGETFQGYRTASIGKIGERRKKIRFNKLGRFDEGGVIFKFSASAAALRGIISASIDARPLR